MEKAELVVIGAGIYGLAMAKTYLQLHPESSIIVLEAAPSLGGTWAKHRLFPGLRTNNLLGMYEYPDFPMHDTAAEFGVGPEDHITGALMNKYLKRYAKKFGVYKRIRFCSQVLTAERQANRWILSYIDLKTEDKRPDFRKKEYIGAEKLVVATGLTGEPLWPQIPGKLNFDGPLMHSRDFPLHIEKIRGVQNVVVLGGNKSAWDIAYDLATSSQDTTVHMVIRGLRNGPCWMSPPYVTPFKLALEKLILTRLITWFSPCIWATYPRLVRWFLHSTFIGILIVHLFFYILGSDIFALNGYDNNQETKKLKPLREPSGAFWVGTSLSILNYPTDFYELVRQGRIKVYITNVSRLYSNCIRLSTGDILYTDAVICATGWKHHPPVSFLPDGTSASLGLPQSSPPSSRDEMTRLADAVILKKFPYLRAQPKISDEEKGRENVKAKREGKEGSFRLFRFMVPPSHIKDRNIGFVGMHKTIATMICASVQALWMTAYLNGSLLAKPSTSLPKYLLSSSSSSADETTPFQWEAVLHSRFCRWRYPLGYGESHPDLVLDSIPYVDLMLKELGLETMRKKGIWANWFSGYGPRDYATVVEDWIALRDGAAVEERKLK